MRELICKVIRKAQRAAWMEPADAKDSVRRGACASSADGSPERFDGFAVDMSLGAQAVRKARVAAAMHMDQAAGLRAQAALARPRSATLPSNPIVEPST